LQGNGFRADLDSPAQDSPHVAVSTGVTRTTATTCYGYFRTLEERHLRSYRAGHVTAGELQQVACLAALAAYALEPGSPRPRRPGGRLLTRALERTAPRLPRTPHVWRACPI